MTRFQTASFENLKLMLQTCGLSPMFCRTLCLERTCHAGAGSREESDHGGASLMGKRFKPKKLWGEFFLFMALKSPAYNMVNETTRKWLIDVPDMVFESLKTGTICVSPLSTMLSC